MRILIPPTLSQHKISTKGLKKVKLGVKESNKWNISRNRSGFHRYYIIIYNIKISMTEKGFFHKCNAGFHKFHQKALSVEGIWIIL